MTEKFLAGILTIGNEVLEGIVRDTNSNWLERRLRVLGVKIMRHATVLDDKREIAHGLSFLFECCNMVITTGGLGPTHDDMTLESIAEYLGVEIQEDETAAEIVQRQYRELYKKGMVDSPDYTEKRAKMAMIPEGAKPLDNRVGGAPGILIETEKTILIVLPGVPKEMKFIFDDSIAKRIRKQLTGQFVERVVEFPIKDETVFAPFIDKVMEMNREVYIKSMPKTYGSSDVLRVWISARSENEKELTQRVNETIANLEAISGLQSKPATEE